MKLKPVIGGIGRHEVAPLVSRLKARLGLLHRGPGSSGEGRRTRSGATERVAATTSNTEATAQRER